MLRLVAIVFMTGCTILPKDIYYSLLIVWILRDPLVSSFMLFHSKTHFFMALGVINSVLGPILLMFFVNDLIVSIDAVENVHSGGGLI